ncbi:MAG: cytochrome c oxidase subunit I [Candidatus Palauibacterales bacterium]|nr:cytochrome c oxidase subunit I [Candidatus Palauibacterales bacterium]MDP2483730.1 cytochrome c oxidase subunit I [Candidatus Palauibacterales bacterium]
MAVTGAVGAETPGVGAQDHGGTYSGGIWSWLTTVDHKRIGVMYGVSAFLFFLVGGIEALLIRLQLGTPENTLINPDLYNQLFTMHGTTMVFLAIMPLSAAFFNFIVPLQIGARDVAFPRLNAFSFWVFFLGALFMNSSFLFGGAPDAGWFGYANLTSTQYSPGMRVDFWVLGLLVLGVSSIAAALNFIVTIINLRCEGMHFMRMPLFTWMTLITSFLLVMAFPAITVGLVLLMFDRMFGTQFFNPLAGGDVLLWQHLFWIFGHPEVYILLLPGLGMVSEIIPVFSRKPLFGYAFVVYSGVLIAFLGFGVWAHHMFAVGLGPVANTVFAAATMLIAIPTGVKIFNWIATLWGGSLRLKTPLYFCLGFIAMFIIGGLSGVMHASAAADLQQTDTYFIVAHIHYVLFGGVMFALFAGMYYWIPKVTGRMLSDRLGKIHFWIMLVSFNLTFFPQHFLGLHGMPRRTFTYESGLGFEAMNLMSTVGALLLGSSMLIFIWNVLQMLRKGPPTGADPWGGSTLEWSIASPPPHYNFKVLPKVYGRDPLWAADTSDSRPGDDVEAPEPHMPGPSAFPLTTAIGIVVMAAGGLTTTLPVLFVGVAVVLFGVYGWAFQPLEH